jgi:hypothetical protein
MTSRSPQPYHVYLDLDFINNDVESGAQPHPLVFEETRNSPFLEGDCSNYFCSIARFSIMTGGSLPVFIPRMDMTSTDVNKTVYKVTLGYAGTSVTQNVEYSQNSGSTSTLLYGNTPPNSNSPTSTSYYNIYNYQDFIDMVNYAMQTAWTNVCSQNVPTLNGTIAPFLEFDPSTNKCTLNAQQSVFDITYAGGIIPATLVFNSRLMELFVGFQNIFMQYGGDLNYALVIKNRNGANLSTVKNGTATTIYVQMYQEISSVPLWNPVASLVFCSSMLPISPTQTSTPTVISNQSDNLTSSGDNSNLANQLSDFELAIQDANQYRPIILYAPASEYRLIDMFSGSNLNRINIQVFWKDQFGNLNPFLLDPGCAAHIKLMFRRKDFYIA